jgi:hypothetical protein
MRQAGGSSKAIGRRGESFLNDDCGAVRFIRFKCNRNLSVPHSGIEFCSRCRWLGSLFTSIGFFGVVMTNEFVRFTNSSFPLALLREFRIELQFTLLNEE